MIQRTRTGAGLLICLAGALSLLSVGRAVPLALTAQTVAGHAGLSAGLIVKLHEVPARAGALAQGRAAAQAQPQVEAQAQAQAQANAERVHQMLATTGLGRATLRPVGRSAQLLDFGSLLTAAEAQRMAEQLRQRPEVEWVALNERDRRLQVPNDPYFAASAASPGQWWLRMATGSSANVLQDRLRGVPGVQAAWLNNTGNAQAVVAVLDTGITAHPDLDAHVLPGYDFVSTVAYANDGDGRDADPSDPGDWVSQADKDSNPALFAGCDVDNSSWHGSLIAGIVAAVSDNGVGVAGINWNGRVLPVRVAGKCGAEVADIVDGMRWAAGLEVVGAPLNANPARVVNISFGGSAPCNAAYQEAIDELRALGVVVVAAAGNGHGNLTRPASCAGVIGVAALNRDGFKANYSNFGPAVVVATVGGDPPGEGRWGALLGDDGLLTLDNLGLQAPETASYGRAAGTSFAAPVVAGVVSLMLSANPTLSVTQIIDGVRRSARPHGVSGQMGVCSAQNPGRCLCTTSTCGAGILDAPQALLYALDPAGYVAPAQTAAVFDSPDLEAAMALGSDLPPNDGAVVVATVADSGGGAASPAWLLLLAVAALLLHAAHLRAKAPARTAQRTNPPPNRNPSTSVADRLHARRKAPAQRC